MCITGGHIADVERGQLRHPQHGRIRCHGDDRGVVQAVDAVATVGNHGGSGVGLRPPPDGGDLLGAAVTRGAHDHC